MLKELDLSPAVDKDTYKARLPALHERLYDLTHAAFKANVAMIIVFEGWATAGKGGAIKTLTERLDPRGYRVVPITPPRTSETHFPWMWRYWQKLPAYGQTAIFDQSWYRRVLIERLMRGVNRRAYADSLQDILEYEQMLAADGTGLLKLWLHIDRDTQRARIKALRKDKLTAWQVSDEDAAQQAAYGEYRELADEAIARTDRPHAPWLKIAALDKHHARLAVFEAVIAAYERRLGASTPAPEKPAHGGRRKEAAHA
jgi:polyphosphate kinase 2 (PPK2 family)